MNDDKKEGDICGWNGCDGKIEICEENYPYSLRKLICEKCDSTYCLFNMPTKRKKIGTFLKHANGVGR